MGSQNGFDPLVLTTTAKSARTSISLEAKSAGHEPRGRQDGALDLDGGIPGRSKGPMRTQLVSEFRERTPLLFKNLGLELGPTWPGRERTPLFGVEKPWAGTGTHLVGKGRPFFWRPF